MTNVINEQQLKRTLDEVGTDPPSVREVLARASAAKGLSLAETAALLSAGPEDDDAIFAAAAELNLQLHGKRITFYGVCYISDFCINNCRYCSDSKKSSFKNRCRLTEDEFKADLVALLAGHDFEQICFLTGEDPTRFTTGDLVEYLRFASTLFHATIIINVPPLTVQEFSSVRQAVPNRLHFRVFQETYDRSIYAREHPGGPKANYGFRISSQDRALEAGFDEVGLGVLFGLNDTAYGYRLELMALIAHAKHLFDTFGEWPRSISFPRIRQGVGLNGYLPPRAVSDRELVRCVAVARLAVPATHTVITCRETAEFRRAIRPIVNIEDFGAKPGPGGNTQPEPDVHFQMQLPDMRPGRVVRDEIIQEGYEVR